MTWAVIVAEETPSIASQLQGERALANARVVPVSSTAAALDNLAVHDTGAILIDVDCGSDRALALMRSMRRLDRTLLMIAVGGARQTAALERVCPRTADYVLTKPLDLQHIVRRLNHTFQLRQTPAGAPARCHGQSTD